MNEGDRIAQLSRDVQIILLSKLSIANLTYLSQISDDFKRLYDDNIMWESLLLSNFNTNSQGYDNPRLLYIAYMLKKRIENGENITIRSDDFKLVFTIKNGEIEIDVIPDTKYSNFLFGRSNILNKFEIFLKTFDNITYEKWPKGFPTNIWVKPDSDDTLIRLIYTLLNQYGFNLSLNNINCNVCTNIASHVCEKCQQKFCENHVE